jgi:hypothetical protein
MISAISYRVSLDRLGIIAASICLLHCAVIPVMIIAMPMIGTTYASNSEWLHLPLVLFASILGGYAIFLGKLHHRQKSPTIIAIVGVALLLASLAEAQLGELAEYLASLGALTMAYAHIRNMRATCACCPSSPPQ